MARLKRPDQYIIDTREYWMPAGFGLVAGGIYTIPSATASAVGMAFGKKPDVKKTIGSTSGMAIGIAYDIWARRTGTHSLGAARTGIIQIVKTPATRVAVGSMPTTTGVIAAYTATRATTGLIESVVSGTSNPVTGTRSPKPFWIPLPLWVMMN